MRYLTLLLLGLALAACAAPPGSPPASPLPPTSIPAVAELADASGPVSVIGYLYTTDGGVALADYLSFAGAGPPQPLGAPPIWLAGAAAPPAEQLAEQGGVRYAVVRVSGQLEGPGSYGPAGSFRYQIGAPQIAAPGLRSLEILLLEQNSELYRNQAVQLQGQLLVGPGTALLVERLGPGGVPATDARQIKLVAPLDDPALLEQLTTAGTAAFGPATVVGVWRGDRLYPLGIFPAPGGSPLVDPPFGLVCDRPSC